MSKQQLESISAAFSAFKPSSRPEKPTPRKPILLQDQIDVHLKNLFLL